MISVRIVFMSLTALLAASSSFAQGSETVVYFHGDAIGSVRLVTDANGQVIERYDYLPFGEPYPPSAPVVETRRFGGKERDNETGLDYSGARYYSSLNGRFTVVDPLLDVEAAVLNPQRWNRYVYSLNHPLKFTDPDGRSPKLAMLALKVGHALYKGYDVYTTVEGIVEAGGEIVSPDSTLGQRAIGVVKLAGELSGVTDIFKGGKAALKLADDNLGSASRLIPDDAVVVRGGVSPMPEPGKTFSGAVGRDLEDAAQGVPHNQIRATTAGRIRGTGGSVELKPEPTRTGTINHKHVNICLGPGSDPECVFDPLQPNPVPKSERVR